MLYTKAQIKEWKKNKTVFYLGKVISKRTSDHEWQKKLAPKTKFNHKSKLRQYKQKNPASAVLTKERYVLYFEESDRKAGMVTYDEVLDLRKLGIKVLAEKDGCLC